MKKTFLALVFLLIGLNAFADDTCRNTNWPVSALKELGLEELKEKFCAAEKGRLFYTKQKEPGAVNSCVKAKNLISTLLKNEHDKTATDCETLYPELFRSKVLASEYPSALNQTQETLPHFSSVAEGAEEPVRLYCMCESWAGCRSGIADKIFIQLFTDGNPKMEIGITPKAFRYFEETSNSEYVYTKDGFSGTVTATSFLAEKQENYYKTPIISFSGYATNLSGSITIDRRTLKLIWNNRFRTAHKCSVVDREEFRKKILDETKSGFKSAFKKHSRAKERMKEDAQYTKEYKAKKVEI